MIVVIKQALPRMMYVIAGPCVRLVCLKQDEKTKTIKRRQR
jgi:hypothetical protein